MCDQKIMYLGVHHISIQTMSKHHIQNYESFSGISGIGNHDSLINELGSKQEIFYTIKINAPAEGTASVVTSGRLEEDHSEKGQKSISHKNPFTAETTGYEINRDQYSDDEIREAFQVIDINKDGTLSFEDLAFFLRCMGEEFTQDEVQEMINMVSADPKGVLLDDFKKVGKGKLIPFAGTRLPEPTAPLKQALLNNLTDSGLLDLDPEDLLLAEETNFVSHAKFEADRSHRYEQVKQEQVQAVEEVAPLLRSRTQAEIAQRRTETRKLSMLNVERIIENLLQCGKEHLESREIADLITINDSHARQLFTEPFKRILTQQAVLDAILFSSRPPIQRLELVLDHFNREKELKFDEWLDVLVYMLGSDQKELVRRRLNKMLAYRKVELKGKFDKPYIVKLMSEELSSFNW